MFNFKTKFKLGHAVIYNYCKPYIIAEIGSNYDQSIKKLFNYIDLAKKLGADCVKFQLFKASDLLDKKNKSYEIFKNNELPVNWLQKISLYCKKKKIDFVCSPFSVDAVKHLKKTNICAFKIASSELLNFDLINEISKQKKPIILSTGMASLDEVTLSLKYLKKKKIDKVVLLQCTSNYPTKIQDLNLNVISTYKKLYDNLPIGLSDHSSSALAPAFAVARGSCVIEKHLTIDKNNSGPDHFYAMNPSNFSEMVKNIKICHQANGTFRKKKHPMEKKYGRKKGIFYLKNLKKNQKISYKNITIKRFKIGIQAKDIELIINKKLKKDVIKHEPVKKGDFTNEKKR